MLLDNWISLGLGHRHTFCPFLILWMMMNSMTMAMAIFNCLHRKKRSCKAARRSESLFSTQHNEVVFWFIGVGVGAAKNNKQTNIQTYNKRALMLLITDSLSAHFMKYWLMSASNRENLCSREAALEKLLNGNGKLGVECICSTVSLSHTHLYQSLSMSTGQRGSFFSAFFNDMLMLYYYITKQNGLVCLPN